MSLRPQEDQAGGPKRRHEGLAAISILYSRLDSLHWSAWTGSHIAAIKTGWEGSSACTALPLGRLATYSTCNVHQRHLFRSSDDADRLSHAARLPENGTWIATTAGIRHVLPSRMYIIGVHIDTVPRHTSMRGLRHRASSALSCRYVSFRVKHLSIGSSKGLKVRRLPNKLTRRLVRLTLTF